MKRRILALALALAVVVTYIPAFAFNSFAGETQSSGIKLDYPDGHDVGYACELYEIVENGTGRVFNSYQFKSRTYTFGTVDFQKIANRVYRSVLDAFSDEGSDAYNYCFGNGIDFTPQKDDPVDESKSSDKLYVMGEIDTNNKGGALTKSDFTSDMDKVMELVNKCIVWTNEVGLNTVRSKFELKYMDNGSSAPKSFNIKVEFDESIKELCYRGDFNDLTNDGYVDKLAKIYKNLAASYTSEESKYLDKEAKKYVNERIQTDKAVELTNEYKKKLKEILADAPQNSDYEAARYFFDYLAYYTHYSHKKAGDDGWTDVLGVGAYNGILGKKGYGGLICSDYAETYKLLCDLAGVECKYISGYGGQEKMDGTSPEGHAWNAVKLDGKWYWVDLVKNNRSWFLIGNKDDEGSPGLGGTFSEFHNLYDDKYGPSCGREFVENVPDHGYVFKGHTSHQLYKVDEDPATCAYAGTKAHYECEGCTKLFSDSEGKQVVSRESLIIPKKSHTMKYINPVTYGDGCTNWDLLYNNKWNIKGYWTCTECGQAFKDPAGKNIAEPDEFYYGQHNLELVDADDEYGEPHYKCKDCGEILKAGSTDGGYKRTTSTKPAEHQCTGKQKKVTFEGDDNEYQICHECHKIVYWDSNIKNEKGNWGAYVDYDGSNGKILVLTLHEKNSDAHSDDDFEWFCPNRCLTYDSYDYNRINYTDYYQLDDEETLYSSDLKDSGKGVAYGGDYPEYIIKENDASSYKISASSDSIYEYTEHVFVKAGNEATCTSDGTYKSQWKCTKCGQYSSSQDNVREELTQYDSAIIEKKPHNFDSNGVCKDCGIKEEYKNCTLIHFEKIEPTCCAVGKKEHYECKHCGKIFADKNFETELKYEDLVIPKKPHQAEPHAGYIGYEYYSGITSNQGPVCLDGGIKPCYYSCSVCSQYVDKDGNLLEFKDIYQEPLKHEFDPTTGNCIHDGCTETVSTHNHALVIVNDCNATCTKVGAKKHYECVTCGKMFSDAAGTKEVAANTVVLPEIDHIYYDGKCVLCGKTECEHEMTRVSFREPTCCENGVKTHYVCSKCNEMFLDQYGQTKVNQSEIEIQKLDHLFMRMNYNYCIRCGQLFNSMTKVEKQDKDTCTTLKHDVCYTLEDGTNRFYSDQSGNGKLDLKNTNPQDDQHVSTEWITTVRPTLYTEGKAVRYCTECKKILEEKTLNKISDSVKLPDPVKPTEDPEDPPAPPISDVVTDVIEGITDAIQGKVEVPSTIENGKEVANITKDQVKDIIDKAKGDDVILKLQSAKTNEAGKTELGLPKDLLEQVAGKDMNLTIETGGATVSFDTDALSKIGAKDVTLSMNTTVSGNTVTLDITLKNDKNKAVTQFGTGNVHLTLPLPDNADKDSKVLYLNGQYVDDMNAEIKGGKVEFDTHHFSKYSLMSKAKANQLLVKSIKKSTLGKIKASSSKKAVKLSWSKAKGTTPTSTVIYRSTKAKKGFKKIATLTNGSKSYTDKAKLKKGKKYYYKVCGTVAIDGKMYSLKKSQVVSVKHK